MKNILKVFIVIALLLSSILIFSAEKMTVEEFKNKLNSIKRPEITSMECEIEITENGEAIDKIKLYRESDKIRIEMIDPVSGNPVVYVKDSLGTFELKNGKWDKSDNTFAEELGKYAANINPSEFIEGKAFEIESATITTAIIKYSEPYINGISHNRVGINLENGDVVFHELSINEGIAKTTYSYEKYNKCRYLNEMNIDINVGKETSTINIRYLNVEVNNNLKNDIFNHE